MAGSNSPALLTATLDSNQLLRLDYTANANGQADITVRAKGRNITAQVIFHVTVNAVNDLPVAAADAYTWIEIGGVVTVVAPAYLQ